MLAAHLLKDKPDPKCEECKGSGITTSTYNPKSKWDWYVIGGRWDGVIQGTPREDSKDGGFNFGDEHHQTDYNVVKVAELVDVPTQVTRRLTNAHEVANSFYALVTPDGEWHGQGDMGWFGMSSNDKNEQAWQKEVEEILKKYADHQIVGVDCHI